MLKYHLRKLRKSTRSNFKTTLEHKRINIAVEQKSTYIINLVGYVILFLILLDYSFLLAFAQVFEPTWAYNTAGQLVENVWGILLGCLLIFYRRDQDLVKPLEFRLLSFLSWFILFIGISYFLITPVIVGNAFRIHREGKAQVTNQIEQQKSQAQQYIQQLNQVNPEKLNTLLQNSQNDNTKVDSTQQFKINLVGEVKQKQATAEKELLTEFNQQQNNLVKTTVKWSIGAIVSGVCLILIWKHTKWTRGKY